MSQEKSGSFWLPLFVIVIGAFAAILNNSSLNVAIPRFMTIFGVDASKIQWVLTAYMLTSGVVIPITGYLGDRFGTKRVFVISLSIFTLGSVLCALSWSANSMIFFRIIQGIGGGAIMPTSMAIVYRIVPREKIGIALGVWGMSAVMAPAIGPTLGGYIVDNFEWYFLFVINIPVGLLGIFLSAWLLKEGPVKPGLVMDKWGFITSTIGFFALLLALSEGPREGWTSYYVVILFIISFYSLLLFVLIELFTSEPMIDLRLLKNPTFSMSTIITGLITIGLFGGVFLIPLFTQNLMGMTPYQTGLMLMPAALVTGIMMPISGFLFDRIGAKPLGLVGIIITAVTTWELHTLAAQTSKEYIIRLMVIRAVGMGLAMMPITTAGMNVVPKHLVGRASALNNVFRQVFASFGIAVLTAVLQNRQVFHFSHLADSVSTASPVTQIGLQNLQESITAYTGQPANIASQQAISFIYGAVQKQALVLAMDDTFLVAAIFVFVAIPLIFFLQKPSVVADKKTGN
jgi:EmrB/QacA subfamily drug resistance transporter